MSSFCDFLPDDPSCQPDEPEVPEQPEDTSGAPADTGDSTADSTDPEPEDVGEKIDNRPSEDVYETGSSTAALLLGIFALLKFTVPLGLYFAVGSSSGSSLAWLFWFGANSTVWGLLTFLWILTYVSSGIASFYMLYYELGGIYGGWAIFVIGLTLMVLAFTSDSSMLTYLIIYAVFEPALVYLSQKFYPDAYLYYFPKLVQVAKPPVKVKPVPVEPDTEEEPEPEPVEPEPVDPTPVESETSDEEGNSPFVDFLLTEI